jgi:hypothetical protein
MTAVIPAGRADGSQRAAVDAALLVLERMGLAPADLLPGPREAAQAPTFAEYVPVVAAAVTAGTRCAYGSYWNRVIEHWGDRRLDEVTPSQIRQLMACVKANVVARRNARGGRSAAEHLVAALRCLYARAEDDGLITPARDEEDMVVVMGTSRVRAEARSRPQRRMIRSRAAGYCAVAALPVATSGCLRGPCVMICGEITQFIQYASARSATTPPPISSTSSTAAWPTIPSAKSSTPSSATT